MLKCQKGAIAEVRELILAKADVNATSFAGYCALHFAAAKGHTDIVELLIRAKASALCVTEATNPSLLVRVLCRICPGLPPHVQHDASLELPPSGGRGDFTHTINDVPSIP
jgi:hypothetical protein